VNATPSCKAVRANPRTVVAELDSATSREWRGWELPTLKEFLNLEDGLETDRVAACQVAVTNPDVFSDWDLFQVVNSPFNNRRSNFHWLDDPDIAEIAWTCECLQALGLGTFTDSAARYIGSCCLLDGLLYFPWTNYVLCEDPAFRGMVPDHLAPVYQPVVEAWKSGKLQSMNASDIDDAHHEDPVLMQFSKILGILAYFKEQEN